MSVVKIKVVLKELLTVWARSMRFLGTTDLNLWLFFQFRYRFAAFREAQGASQFANCQLFAKFLQLKLASE